VEILGGRTRGGIRDIITWDPRAAVGEPLERAEQGVGVVCCTRICGGGIVPYPCAIRELAARRQPREAPPAKLHWHRHDRQVLSVLGVCVCVCE
jgi:hypothetical protein